MNDQSDQDYAEKHGENRILIPCALRFNGHKFREETGFDVEEAEARFFRTGELPADPLQKMALFFLLQRYLYKWGGEREPRHGRRWRLFRTFFLEVAREPVPEPYRLPEYDDTWQATFAPQVAACLAAIERRHREIVYDDDAPPV